MSLFKASPFAARAALDPILKEALGQGPKGPQSYALKGWAAAALSARSAAQEPPMMDINDQRALANFFDAFNARLGALGREEPKSELGMKAALDRLESLVGFGNARPARLAARAVEAALEAAHADDQSVEIRQWQAFCALGAQTLARLCERLRAAGELPADLAEACQSEADNWLSYDGGMDEDVEESPEGVEFFMIEQAPSAMALCVIGAESGLWPEVLRDEFGNLSARKMLFALGAFESGPLFSTEGKTERETLAAMEPMIPLGKRLGVAAAGEAGEKAPALALAFAKGLLGSIGSAEQAEPGALRPGGLGLGIMASNSLANAFLLGMIQADPSLARARDERGHTPLSLFNEALALAGGAERAGEKGWLEGGFEVSERALCQMIEASRDPSCLVALPDPAAMAASPAIRAAVEAAAVEQAAAPSRSILGRGVKGGAL